MSDVYVLEFLGVLAPVINFKYFRRPVAPRFPVRSFHFDRRVRKIHKVTDRWLGEGLISHRTHLHPSHLLDASTVNFEKFPGNFLQLAIFYRSTAFNSKKEFQNPSTNSVVTPLQTFCTNFNLHVPQTLERIGKAQRPF